MAWRVVAHQISIAFFWIHGYLGYWSRPWYLGFHGKIVGVNEWRSPEDAIGSWRSYIYIFTYKLLSTCIYDYICNTDVGKHRIQVLTHPHMISMNFIPASVAFQDFANEKRCSGRRPGRCMGYAGGYLTGLRWRIFNYRHESLNHHPRTGQWP